MVKTYRRLRPIQTKFCVVCGSQYTSVRRDSLYCSSSCGVTAYNQRLEAKDPEKFAAKLKLNAIRAKDRRIAYKAFELKKREDLQVLEEKRRTEALRRQNEQEEKEKERKKRDEEKRKKEEDFRSEETYRNWRTEHMALMLKTVSDLDAEYTVRDNELKVFTDERSYCDKTTGEMVVHVYYEKACTAKENELNKWINSPRNQKQYEEGKKLLNAQGEAQEKIFRKRYQEYIKQFLAQYEFR